MKVPVAVACLLALASRVHANIPDVIASRPELSILSTAMQMTSLDSNLASNIVPMTIFAPTNEAMEFALDALNVTLEEADASLDRLLSNMVGNHLVAGKAVASANMTDGLVVDTLMDQSITVSIGADGVFFTSANDTLPPAKLVQADLPSGDYYGSVIHIIDSVLLPAVQEHP